MHRHRTRDARRTENGQRGGLGKPPLDIEGRHGHSKAIGRFAGFGAMIDPYRISRSAMPTMDGMKVTRI